MSDSILTQTRLKELLHYDPTTGIFTRLVATARRTKHGDVAGTLNSEGYRVIMVEGKRYQAHRLAWLYVHGVWPPHQVDHKNGIKDANWIDNLREATQNQNMANQAKRADNTSGFKGVSWDNPRRKWKSQIRIRGKVKYLGLFTTPEYASAAYQAAAREYHGEFYHDL